MKSKPREDRRADAAERLEKRLERLFASTEKIPSFNGKAAFMDKINIASKTRADLRAVRPSEKTKGAVLSGRFKDLSKAEIEEIKLDVSPVSPGRDPQEARATSPLAALFG